MKNMSFEKLIAIFGASFFAVIILAVIIIKTTSGPKIGSTVVTQRHQPQMQPVQDDILVVQLRREKEAARLANEQAAQREEALKKQNEEIMSRLTRITEAVGTGMNELEQRIAAMEQSRRHVQIIKPERKPRTQAVVRRQRVSGKRLSSNSGYEVQATVGKRVWVAVGDYEDSVTVGEPLPTPKRPPVVRAVDDRSGIVITSSRR